jgi:uncharacterized damage-inducible protein DinB
MPALKIIRTLMEYHVASNRRLWDHLLEQISDEQFIQTLDYSRGSIRHQVVHLAATDRYWLHDIQAKPVTGLEPEQFPTRGSFSATWQSIGQALLEYVESLSEADLDIVPDGLLVARWAALLHIVNHGTDHRAQVLSMLHGLGAPTFAQDVIDHLRGQGWVSVADVLRLIRLRRGAWEQTLAAIPRERMAEIMCGEWSIKDTVAHLTWYDREMVGVLTTRRLAGSEWWNLPQDQRNQQIFEQHRDQPLDAVLQEHDQIHRELIGQIERLDDQDLNDPARIGEMLPGWKLWMLLEGNTWMHYLEHTEAVWALRMKNEE